jgi:carbon dioxide concentrating mechanism protein CcmN
MYVRPLHPSNNFDSYISGEVTIDPSAVIAPGVLIQASPDSRVIIGAGVCIGMGAILHAHEGILEVEAGANLGAGVLVVGKGKIGANACIGATTTILNRSIEAGQVVAAASLIGDESRQVAAASVGAITGVTEDTAPTRTAATVSGKALESATNSRAMPKESSEESAQVHSEPTEAVPKSPETAGTKVYGQEQLNRMLSTMFPHRQSLSRPLQDDQSPSDKT